MNVVCSSVGIEDNIGIIEVDVDNVVDKCGTEDIDKNGNEEEDEEESVVVVALVVGIVVIDKGNEDENEKAEEEEIGIG
jgi:hypothetical protein